MTYQHSAMTEAVQQEAQAPDPLGRFLIGAAYDGLDARDSAPNWLIRRLAIAPGECTLLTGDQNTGKTWLAQSLAVSVATGRGVLGDEGPVRQGGVLHMTFEQNARLTIQRYKELCRGMGVSWGEVRKWVAIAEYPIGNFSTPSLFDHLAWRCRDYRLCILDSLSAACGSLNEDHHSIGDPLRSLARVSAVTGCTFLLLHHLTKSFEGKTRAQRVRGSGAIMGSCQTAWDLSGVDTTSRRLVCTKDRLDAGLLGTELRIIKNDSPDEDGEQRVWFSVADDQGLARIEGGEEISTCVQQVLLRHPIYTLTQSALTEKVMAELGTGAAVKRVHAVISHLVLAGVVCRQAGPKNSHLYCVRQQALIEIEEAIRSRSALERFSMTGNSAGAVDLPIEPGSIQ